MNEFDIADREGVWSQRYLTRIGMLEAMMALRENPRFSHERYILLDIPISHSEHPQTHRHIPRQFELQLRRLPAQPENTNETST